VVLLQICDKSRRILAIKVNKYRAFFNDQYCKLGIIFIKNNYGVK